MSNNSCKTFFFNWTDLLESGTDHLYLSIENFEKRARLQGFTQGNKLKWALHALLHASRFEFIEDSEKLVMYFSDKKLKQ